ncbi:MAG: CPXCG motif-containing cysteine-rich protein [Acidobacteriota bacterium]
MTENQWPAPLDRRHGFGDGVTVYDDSATYDCAFCGEPNQVDVDVSAGPRQAYVEDCQICCRPNLLHIRFDADHCATIDAEPES